MSCQTESTTQATERDRRGLLVEAVLFLADGEPTQAREIYEDAEDYRERLAVRLAELATKLGAEWQEAAA